MNTHKMALGFVNTLGWYDEKPIPNKLGGGMIQVAGCGKFVIYDAHGVTEKTIKCTRVGEAHSTARKMTIKYLTERGKTHGTTTT